MARRACPRRGSDTCGQGACPRGDRHPSSDGICSFPPAAHVLRRPLRAVFLACVTPIPLAREIFVP
ncbi:hypothetical protein AZ16_0464 [Bordetella bronchiseptica B18-5 (C3)]|nr:hypothetical protein AZ15_0483 [Bordetella bronchiseptica A1-7]KDB62845.1 hypothetical protein AZ16_0464 [Bordetella bronchiseptica B18-5 (C3)]KDB72282.1 hypothetical protein AZ21_0456 [Bordetella bronchiseptica B20-10725633]KDC37922.1 hypothetical protein L508_0468 [Bordetella bronchiseptica M435/02/3]KDC60059.1 hypothetical protein L511_0477 [Bordetella bronchiseptica MBORD595]KDD88517.1 hypothetical protein L524_0292 [Bordetella bronchiseptica MBORD762]